jgi:hypothetical protein
MARVKGLAFRTVLRAHSSMRGVASLDSVLTLLDPELAETLRHVSAATWYPLEHYVALWAAIQRVVGNNPDYPRVVGRVCIEQDLRLVHKLAFAALSPATVLGISSRVFNMYYDTGRCQSSRLDEQSVRVSFDDCKGFSSPMWAELRGAIEAFAEQSSGCTARAITVSGGGTGNPECIIDVSWWRPS